MTPLLRVVLSAAVLFGAGAALYAAGPPPAHTGGFGEETCAYCHFENELNDPGGSLSIRGVPASYEPETEYPIEVVLVRPDLKRGGFQLSARFSDGSASGEQAGDLVVEAGSARVDLHDGIQYARQTYAGSEPSTADSIRWLLTWTSPDSAAGPIVFHVAANAANGDKSEFGDFIYLEEATSTTER